MFQALARESIGSRKYKTHADATDSAILGLPLGKISRRGCKFRAYSCDSGQMPVATQRAVDALDQAVQRSGGVCVQAVVGHIGGSLTLW